MRVFDFEKDSEKRWYIVLPEWKGFKSDLEMVLGADMMLDIYAQGESSVSLLLSDDKLKDSYDTITLLETCDSLTGGAYYQVNQLNFIKYDFKIWLCDVTKFIFKDFPEKIYIQNCNL